MLLGARQFFERRGAPTPPLPYDAEVEYLESTGAQYIDTLLTFSSDAVCYCKFARDGASGNQIYGSNVTNFVTFSFGNVSSGNFQWSPGVNPRSTNVSADTAWHETEMCVRAGSPSYVKFDGVETASTTIPSPTFPHSKPMTLFARRGYTGTIYYTDCKVASFSIIDIATNKILIDFIPVRFTNELGQSEGAMYDRVSGEFFRNSGTGSFVIGPDKS